MKRKHQSLSKSISEVWIRRSEVRELGAMMRRGTEASLTMETDSFTYDSLDELLAGEDPIESIELKMDAPSISVTIRRWEVRIFAWNDDLPSNGKFREIVDFVEGHRLPRWLRVTPWIWTGPTIVCTSAASYVSFGLKTLLLASLACLFMVPSLLGLLYHRPPWSQIRFRAEPGRPVNWRGVSWDVAKLVVAALLGVGGTLTVQSLRSSPSTTQVVQAPTPLAQQSPTASDGGTIATH